MLRRTFRFILRFGFFILVLLSSSSAAWHCSPSSARKAR